MVINVEPKINILLQANYKYRLCAIKCALCHNAYDYYTHFTYKSWLDDDIEDFMLGGDGICDSVLDDNVDEQYFIVSELHQDVSGRTYLEANKL